MTPPVKVPCQGLNPCVVRGCTCAVPRFAPRSARVRACECCVARLLPEERALFQKETKKDATVRAVLALLAGELAMEREDEKEERIKAAAAGSPFLDTLDPETRELTRKLMEGRAQ